MNDLFAVIAFKFVWYVKTCQPCNATLFCIHYIIIFFLHEDESPIISNLAAMICAEAIADCLSIVGIVFCIGILFRQFTRNCDCAGNVERGDKAARRGSTVGSVSDGRRSARNTMSTWRPSHETEMYVVGAGITVEQTSTGAVASSPDDR